jgi:hypothetical protein
MLPAELPTPASSAHPAWSGVGVPGEATATNSMAKAPVDCPMMTIDIARCPPGAGTVEDVGSAVSGSRAFRMHA